MSAAAQKPYKSDRFASHEEITTAIAELEAFADQARCQPLLLLESRVRGSVREEREDVGQYAPFHRRAVRRSATIQ